MNRELLKSELRSDEGEKLRSYRDHLGYWTIGVGHLLDPLKGANPAPFGADLRNGRSITAEQSAQLLDLDIDAKMAELDARAPWWRRLSENRQRVVVNMAFQLGTTGLLGFRKAVAAMQTGDFAEAGRQMRDSKWALEDTPARAARLIERMVIG
ncbi:MAG: glycoside hydrolase family protein [Novosphingobium sp.]|nr:glycoside hydrolase family protein [Novosphingobium sp.]